MQYLGGKEKISKQICNFLESVRKPGQLFVDLTVGGCSIISKMQYPKEGYDIHPALISLYKKLSTGDITLPDSVTYEEHKLARNFSNDNPLKAFIGFGCSFAGDYFRGYAKNNRGQNYAKNAKNSLIRKFKTLQNVKFEQLDLFLYEGCSNLIYIDPPYKGTTKYSVDFNYDLFWDKVRELSKNNDVYVSEYQAPSDFTCVFKVDKKLGLRKKEGGQIMTEEKMFKYSSNTIKLLK